MIREAKINGEERLGFDMRKQTMLSRFDDLPRFLSLRSLDLSGYTFRRLTFVVNVWLVYHGAGRVIVIIQRPDIGPLISCERSFSLYSHFRHLSIKYNYFDF